MATPNNLEIDDADFVNAGKTKFNEAIKQLPVGLNVENGVLTLVLYKGVALTVDLTDYFPTRTEVATNILPTANSFSVPGLLQLAHDDDPDDLDSEVKVLGVAGVIRLIEKYLTPPDAVTLAYLISNSNEAQQNAFLLALLSIVKPNTALQAKICEIMSRCVVSTDVVTHRFRNPRHFEFVSNIVLPLTPSYIGRYDANNCERLGGWFADINNPTVAPVVRIERNGVAIANVTCNGERTDVRDALIVQGKIPAGSTFATYGYSYVKVAADNNGQANTYKAFGGSSQTVATTDVGAPATVTCGTVVNPPTTNNPPRIVGTYVDQEVRVAGDYLLDAITGLFADEDALTYSATMGDGSPLMSGISFTPGNAKPFKILASFANQQQPIYIIATDTANNLTKKIFLLTVARPVVTSDPVTVVSRSFGGDTETIEGNGARVKIVNTMSNGATSDYTGGGTYRVVLPYPDQMTITTDANATGVIATKETVTADVTVTLEFKFPDESVITGQFKVKNKVAATSPIVSQLINNIRVIEGAQGVAQLYDVHADGNWSEVTQSDGRFDLIAPYPDGMGIGYGNTGRAFVQTAGNSVTADVDVTIRYTPVSGPVVNGVITVVNQPTPTTENPDPTPTPFVEKFAMRVLSQANGEFNVQLLYKTNLAVGSQLEDCWVEFFTRQGQAEQFLPSSVVNNPASFPDGFKDYNVFMSYFMPATLVQSHSLQHIKVRQTGTSNLLLETTFDPYGLVAGQTKQFYPI